MVDELVYLFCNPPDLDATSGVKSFLIKALDPFIQQDHPGAPVPISITGTYSHPSYKAPSK
jgi:hypothetical protein